MESVGMVVGVLLLLEYGVIVACVLSMAGVLLVVASVLLVVVGVAELQKIMHTGNDVVRPNVVRRVLRDAYESTLSSMTLHS